MFPISSVMLHLTHIIHSLIQVLEPLIKWLPPNMYGQRWTKSQGTQSHCHSSCHLHYAGHFDILITFIHIDLVGQLPQSAGYTYLLTCVDRFTRWPKAIPLTNITAEAVAWAFMSGCIPDSVFHQLLLLNVEVSVSPILCTHCSSSLDQKYVILWHISF